MASDITAQAGKGPRKHRNVSTRSYREGYDAIDWGRRKSAQSAQSAQSARCGGTGWRPPTVLESFGSLVAEVKCECGSL